jgi:hypothetical protein
MAGFCDKSIKEIMVVYSENYSKHMNTICEQNIVLLMLMQVVVL